MASNQAMDSWEQIRQGVSEVERLIGQKAYNLAMIKARQTLEIMVKTLMRYYRIEAHDLSEAINKLYDSHVITGKTRDNYHRIRLLGNSAAHENNNNPSDANNAYHILSQEIYTFANVIKTRPKNAASAARKKKKKRTAKGVMATVDATMILKILIPVLLIILIIAVIKLFSNKSEKNETAETTEMQIEYVTIAETEPMTMPEPETTAAIVQVWTTTDYLRVRTQPNTDCDVLATLNPDTQVEYVGAENEEWAKIMYEGQEAYVSTQYLTMTEVNVNETAAETVEAAPAEVEAAPAE